MSKKQTRALTKNKTCLDTLKWRISLNHSTKYYQQKNTVNFEVFQFDVNKIGSKNLKTTDTVRIPLAI